GRDEAAAAHEVEVRHVVSSEVRVDHARLRIGAHPVRPDLMRREVVFEAYVGDAHRLENSPRDLLARLLSVALVPTYVVRDTRHRVAEVVPDPGGEGDRVDAVGELLAVDADTDVSAELLLDVAA